ncbi:related to nucleolar phosphoprotein [Phialocephala subalpina]|uniref:Related to nucleolar phosphoprotein n=1 Tax=Phialocephala subalpina TaxID=576137 RepID=A0A1L7WH84_9HELO|nr:related to nucleolar phosphoprotein [Phialocephala subalpina]
MVASSLENGSRAQTNGVLAVTASQTSGNAPRSAAVKSSNQKLKAIVRRLAPGLTEIEFTTTLGEDWKLGGGRVDWFLYKPGKDSKDPSKPSRPSRAYLHLTTEAHLLALEVAVRQAVFEDAQNTFTNSCLIGPPVVEFAPYGRIPGGRRRVDARAGTIDQDPEFMAFLEGLANPTTAKEVSADTLSESTPGKQEKATTTPLVQFLKDKKASKSKEAAVKLARKQEAQSAKNRPAKESSLSSVEDKKRGKDGKVDKTLEKAAKEAVRILNREAASKSGPVPPTTSSEAAASQASSPPKLDITSVPGRQRNAVIAAHIRMLQRDLGFTPAQAHRQIQRDTSDAQRAKRAAAAEKAAVETKKPAISSSQPQEAAGTSKPAPNQSRKARGKAASSSTDSESSKTTTSAAPAPTPPAPVVLLRKPATQSAQATPPTQPAKVAPVAPTTVSRKLTIPSEGATQAFVKHANPSQGVTEALLKEAMEKFGPISMVEIDKRKGFAYVDFVDADGLKKAMAENPVPVAQGTVVVMQRKGTSLPPEKKPVHQAPHAPSNRGSTRGSRGGTIGRRGGRGGGRGGGNAGPSETKAPATAPTGPAAK